MLLKYKRTIIVFSILPLMVLCRGIIYRGLVTYHPVSERPTYRIKNEEQFLKKLAKEECEDFMPNTEADVIHQALKITAKHFSYNLHEKEVDPNKTIALNSGHCVAYSAFYATVCNYLFQEFGFAVRSQARCKAYAAKLSLLGYDIHGLFNDPSFRDHDINIIYIGTGKYYVDPTLYDYSYIKSISVK